MDSETYNFLLFILIVIAVFIAGLKCGKND